LTVQPRTISKTFGLGSSAAGDLSLDDTELGYLNGKFGSVIFGSTTGTALMTVDYASAFTHAQPLNLRSSSTGSLTIKDPLNSGTYALTVSSGAVSTLDPAEIVAGNLSITGTLITLSNNVTAAGTQSYTGPVVLSASISLATTTGSATGRTIQFSSSINGTTNNTESLSINGGTGGTLSVTGAIGASTPLATLTLTHSGGATFTGAVTTGTSIVLSNTASASTVSFLNNVSTPTFTTTNNAYNVSLSGSSNSITNAVEFLNTGSLVLGNAAADAFTFGNSFSVTAPSGITLAGSFTAGGTTTLGDSGTGIILAGNTSISTAAVNAPLNLNGALNAAGYSLTLAAGTNTLSFGSTVANLGNTSLTANEINFAASFAARSPRSAWTMR
jgi:hypothetical protein